MAPIPEIPLPQFRRPDLAGLRELQADHATWLRHNFPDQVAAQALMGVVEEVGELAHAQLKGEQKIRESAQEVNQAAKRDAVGDIVIFLMGYCTNSHISLADCLEEAWDEVSKRDWQRFPVDGVSR